MEFLNTKWVMDYVNEHEYPLDELGAFTYTRTYSRWLNNLGRREYWHETVKRAIEYNMSLAYQHMLDSGISPDLKSMVEEAKGLFKNIYKAKQMPSGRTLWLGNGNQAINRDYAMGNFNCSFTNIKKWSDLGELFYLLMIGSGVGFKSTKKMAANMEPIRNNYTLTIKPYEEKPKDERLEGREADLEVMGNKATIVINDSKESWVDTLIKFFTVLTEKEYETVTDIAVNFDNIRPKGERLITFGGFASGPQPMQDMFEGIDKVLKNKMDPYLEQLEPSDKGEGYMHVRPIHVLDIGNLIANNVVAGGVRRSAELFLMDSDDYESMTAKLAVNGIWTEEQLDQFKTIVDLLDKLGSKPKWADDTIDNVTKRFSVEKEMNNLDFNSDEYKELQEEQNKLLAGYTRNGFRHRAMSNNSVGFTRKPTKDQLNLAFEFMKLDAEPGFVNLENAAIRVLKALGNDNPTDRQIQKEAEELGLNPCVEIILHSKNVCNLTTINVKAFVEQDENGNNILDREGLLQAQRYSARMGLRMTLIELELPEWNKIQQRDRLLGNSLTGWQDAMGMLGFSLEERDELKKELREISRQEADDYSKHLRINAPMFTTAVKPEGTLSQVMGGVSSGLHWAHSPYYIRRIRVTSTDPLAKVAKELNWGVHAEVGTNGFMDEKNLEKEEQLEDASTWVVDFPVKSGSGVTKNDITVDEQFDNYFSFQENYTDMNTSNTITVKPDEWGLALERVWGGWEDFIGVSFLSHDGGTYVLAPYEEITEEEFENTKGSMEHYDPELLKTLEFSQEDIDTDIVANDPDCVNGVCPVR